MIIGVSATTIKKLRHNMMVKLAIKGLECLSIPDLFHASNEIVKLFGLRLNRKKASVPSLQVSLQRGDASISSTRAIKLDTIMQTYMKDSK